MSARLHFASSLACLVVSGMLKSSSRGAKGTVISSIFSSWEIVESALMVLSMDWRRRMVKVNGML